MVVAVEELGRVRVPVAEARRVGMRARASLFVEGGEPRGTLNWTNFFANFGGWELRL